MKWKDVLKGVVIGVFIATMAFSLGQCTRAADAVEISATVEEIADSLVKEEAIKMTLNENYAAFMQAAKATNYGKTVLLCVSFTDSNILYTMSVAGTINGITSIDFTKQVTVSPGIVDIYYEGVRTSGYYCYAKQLLKEQNCDQVKIPKQSIFEQVAVMLFKGGELI